MKSLSTIIRILLALIFLLSSLFKLLNPSDFLLTLKQLNLFNSEINNWIAIVVILFEFIIALAFLFNLFVKEASYLTLLLLLIFTATLFTDFLHIRQTSCGCFGDLFSEDSTTFSLLRNFALVFLLLFNLTLIEFIKSGKNFYKSYLKERKTYYLNLATAIIIFLLSTEVLILSRTIYNIKHDFYFSNQNVSILKEGEIVPDVILLNSGNKISKINFAGKRTLLLFFSTDCSICHDNIKNWEEIINSNSTRSEIIPICMDHTNSNKSIFNDETIEIYYPYHGTLKTIFKVYVYPLTVLINNNHVEKTYLGLLSDNDIKQIDSIINNEDS
ncbi:MAG: DoxX family membrane protein [Melioribacteraceae bacterium]|nr:DoxX family membrane protein [Melioribacteraceae bacterium]MCF8354174.1 DoxX family membrane protein [Melioribacteraceae bacterium]MCF8394712.1 DoxX family membrane protein [Melioribacteraceae bacterium]MCF8418097.1 DoxX family membrane protein [Melioribacteraceae bacterium]